MTKTDNFIRKSYLLHNNRYDYSLVKYIKSLERVNIICPMDQYVKVFQVNK